MFHCTGVAKSSAPNFTILTRRFGTTGSMGGLESGRLLPDVDQGHRYVEDSADSPEQ